MARERRPQSVDGMTTASSPEKATLTMPAPEPTPEPEPEPELCEPEPEQAPERKAVVDLESRHCGVCKWFNLVRTIMLAHRVLTVYS